MTKEIESQDHLLCCGYVLVSFKSLAVQVEQDGISCNWRLLCATGFMADGHQELLGLWLGTGADADVWQAAFLDLKLRGVERIRFVIGGDLASAGGGRTVLFGLTELPSIEQTLAGCLAQVAPRHRGAVECALRVVASAGSSDAADEALRAFERGSSGERFPEIVARWRLALAHWTPLFELPATLRRIVLAGDRTAATLHASLIRSIRRHGSFASQGEALDFAADALLRAERRLERGRAVRVVGSRPRRLGSAVGQTAPGLR